MNNAKLDWSTVGYTVLEMSIVKGSLADALAVAARIAADNHPIEGQEISASAASTVRPGRK